MLKGLEARLRLPRLGVIGLGVRVLEPGGKDHTKEVSYFVLPAELREKLSEAQPTRLAVLLPSDEPDRVLQATYERRKGRTVVAKCDGEVARDVEQGQDVPCQKPGSFQPCPLKCRAKGHLNVMLPQGGIGVYWISCGGEQRLADLWMELQTYKKTFGRLTNIVFEAVRVPTQEQYRDARGEIRWREGHPVHLRCAIATEQAMHLSGLDVRELPGGQILRDALPPPDEDEEVAPESNGEAGQSATVSATERPAPVGVAAPTGGAPADVSPAEWDISLCYSAAKRAGVPPPIYEAFLKHTYHTDVDNLPLAALAVEARAWQAVEAAPAEGPKRRDKILALVNLAMKGKALR